MCLNLNTLTYYLAGSQVQRFDPTAYIQDRQHRLKEADVKKLVYIIFSFCHLWQRRSLMLSLLGTTVWILFFLCQTEEGTEGPGDVARRPWEGALTFPRGLSSDGPVRQQRPEFIRGAAREQELLWKLVSGYGWNAQKSFQVVWWRPSSVVESLLR